MPGLEERTVCSDSLLGLTTPTLAKKPRSVLACAAVARDGSRSLGRICSRVRRSGAALEERTVCSGRLKRKSNTLFPLLEHAIAYFHEFRVRFNVVAQFL